MIPPERETPFRRLHPLSPLFEVARSFLSLVLPGLIVLLLASGDRSEAWYMLAFVPAVGVSLLRYLTLRYRLTADHVVLREGLVFRKVRHIPYTRIQNIDTVQNPVHRMLGVAEVVLQTAGGQEPEATLRVLSVARLAEIRAGVFADRHGAGRVPERPGEELSPTAEAERRRSTAFFRMRPIDVVLFGLLSQRGIALLGGIGYAVYEFGLLERIKDWTGLNAARLSALAPFWILASAVIVLLLLLQAITIAWAFLTLHDFQIVRQDDDLSTTCGLWTHQSATLPRHRIQFVSVRESLLQRLAGRMQLRVLTAGGAQAGEKSQISRRFLVPLVEPERLESILDEVQPAVSFAGLAWSPVHPKARRRLFFRWSILFAIPIAYVGFRLPWLGAALALPALGLAALLARSRARRLAIAVTDQAVYLRDGVLTHVRSAVRFGKIQSVSLRQTPFDRRHRMATLRVDTAGTSDDLAFSVPYLPLRTARRLMRRLRREAASVAFRW